VENFDESIFGNFLKSYDSQCLWVRKAIDRYREDLKRDDLIFKPEYLTKFERLCKCFCFYLTDDPEKIGEQITLMDWQKFVIANLFCWYYKKDNRRRFRRAYIEIPRKNAKTFLCAILAIYMCIADDESAARIYIAGNTIDQAGEAWTHCKNLLDGNKKFKKAFRLLVASLEFDKTKSFIRKVASDSKNLHGKNVSGAICDELHIWEHRDLWDVIFRSTASRRNPLMVGITTAGKNQNGIAFEMHERTTNVLNKIADDDRLFGIIFTIDDNDDWQDPKIWKKANPSLGIAKTWDYMNDAYRSAKNVVSELNDFLNYDLNVWTTASSAWINLDLWKELAEPINDDDLKGKYCYAGLDLSRKQDLTAFVLYFPSQNGIKNGYVKPYFIVPSENFKDKELLDRVPYSAWQEKGYISLTNSATVSDEFVFDQIKGALDNYDVRKVAFDRWGSKEITKLFDARGVKIEDFGQGYKDMSPAIKRFEEMILLKKLRHDGNPCLTWNISNAVITKDTAENVKFDKEKARQRIDGAVATAMAIGVCVREPEKQTPSWILSELNKA